MTQKRKPAPQAPAQFLSRAGILGASDITFEVVEVPEWGGSVRVRGLSAADQDDIVHSCVSRNGDQTTVDLRNLRAKYLLRCLVDKKGNRLLTEADLEALGGKSGGVINRLFTVAERLSAMSEAALEGMVKNSVSDLVGDSSTN